MAEIGDNAHQCFRGLLICRIREIGSRLAARSRDRLYDVPHTTSHTGLIQGGRQLNIVPDRCSFEFEFRVIGLDDGDALVEEVIAYARDELEPHMRRVAPETGFAFYRTVGYDGLETAPDAPIVTLTKALAGRNDHAKVSYGTEAGLYSSRGGIPSILCGPGSIAQATLGQRSAMGAKRVGGDGLGAGVEIIGVNLLERIRRFEQRPGRPQGKRSVDPAPVQLRARGAIQNQNRAVGGVHRLPVYRSAAPDDQRRC